MYKYLYSVIDIGSLKCVDFLWLFQGKDDSRNLYMWAQHNGKISRQQSESFRLAHGIVKYTPKSGEEELKKIINIF